MSPIGLHERYTSEDPFPVKISRRGGGGGVVGGRGDENSTSVRLRMVPSGCRSIMLPSALLPTMDPSGLSLAAFNALDTAILALAWNGMWLKEV